MVNGSEGKLLKSGTNSLLCMKCENWARGRCAKIWRATTRLTTRFVCLKCRGMIKGKMDSIEKLSDKVDTVNEFY